jgi:hypothetical protein
MSRPDGSATAVFALDGDLKATVSERTLLVYESRTSSICC